MINEIYNKQSFDEERALYGADGILIEDCTFDGPSDGESALKEAKNITVENTTFALRYPLWHVDHASLTHIRMLETCRAALWYASDIRICDSVLGGIKALRECDEITLQSTTITSQEFGWFSKHITLKQCELTGEYPFMKASAVRIEQLTMQGKYSFQYVEDMVIENSYLDTKDAFWHSKYVTVKDSVIKGEYLAWYSEHLTLIRCTIIGTQPFCYAKHLIMVDCRMIDTDLAFEKTDVQARINGSIDSIKHPASGYIEADEIKEIILDESATTIAPCEIRIRQES